MIVNQNTGQRPDPNMQISHPLLAPTTEKVQQNEPLGRGIAPQPKDQLALTEAEEKGKVAMKEAFVQGFLAKCAQEGVDQNQLIAQVKRQLAQRTEPTRLGAQLAANPVSTIGSGGIIPTLYGAGRPGPETAGIGGLKGLLSAVGGIPAGAAAGGAAGGLGGAGIGALIALLTRNPKILEKALLGGTIGGVSGGAAGAALGPGEIAYRSLRTKEKPAPKKK